MDAFENLDVWKRSTQLCIDLSLSMLSHRESALKDQLLRSALSIPSSIAEGCERNSKQDYRRFLTIARGTAGELRTQLYVGRESGVLDRDMASRYMREAIEVSKMLNGLIGALETREQAEQTA